MLTPGSIHRAGAACLFLVAFAGAAAGSDVLYEALLGTAQAVEPDALMGAPGQYLGHVVRTRGRLERTGGRPGRFELALPSGRALLRLEPEAASLVLAHARSWLGAVVEVEGLFHQEAIESPAGSPALRAWHVSPVSATGEAAQGDGGPALPLEALVYGGGRYDGRLVRVRGTYRGLNVHDDLPETTRRGERDWILKDGYFAVWVIGHEPPTRERDTARGPRLETGLALEVAGVPSTSNGIVRIAAREVHGVSETPAAVMSRALSTDRAAVPPRVSFSYPADALSPQGHMIVQFSKPMDPARLERGVRVRFERHGDIVGFPAVKLDYRDGQRVLVITPDMPPPPSSEVVVDLLDAVVDVDGRGLVPATKQDGVPAGVVERIHFRSGP